MCEDVSQELYDACNESGTNTWYWNYEDDGVCVCACDDTYCPFKREDGAHMGPACECACPWECGPNSVQLDNCDCVCDPAKEAQCIAHNPIGQWEDPIKYWDSETCECKCVSTANCNRPDIRSRNPETCECECVPGIPNKTDCGGNQVLTDLYHDCECQCNATQDQIDKCFLADPTLPPSAEVNLTFAETLRGDGVYMRFNHHFCTCELEIEPMDKVCPEGWPNAEVFPSDVLSCQHPFAYSYPVCGCMCIPDLAESCMGNEELNESSCECECSQAKVNECNSISGQTSSDEGCSCIGYAYATVQAYSSAGSSSVSVDDTTIFDGASEAILSYETDSQETMTLSSSIQQISNFGNVADTENYGDIQFDGTTTNNHWPDAKVVPVHGDPPPTITGDPHVCTFFGEKYDM